MKISPLVLFSIFFVVSYCYDYDTNEGIIILNDTNFDIALDYYDHLLVNFDRGCKWCRIFRPYYLGAYNESLIENMNVTYAQLDLNTNLLIKERYEIEHHPTQLLFVKSDPYSPYRFTRTKNKDKLLAWLRETLAYIEEKGY